MSFTLDGGGAELRHALRTLGRTPGFTATVVATLGLAIGAIAGVFAVLDRVLLSPLPYGHPDRLVALGVAIGLAAAVAATRALGGLLYGVAAVDVPTFAAMASLMLVIGGLAAYVPARRASLVDPCESLRSD